MASLARAFGNRRIAAVLFLGFASGIPLALTASTLQAWMKTENVDLTVIGLFSLVGMPYALKFLWSPLMDRYVPPFLGRRRGWILICQVFLILGIAAMGFVDPVHAPGITALIAVLVSFSSASQDIVVDAYKTDVLQRGEMGPGASLFIVGYRVAMIFSGSLALILSDHMSWRAVYLVMAASMGLGLMTTIFSPEPEVSVKPPRTLAEAVVQPFLEFFKRSGAIEVLLFIIFYKLDAVIAVALTTPFMMDLGFSRTDIGAVTKGFGLIATIGGTMMGGAMMVRLGLLRSLWLFGVIQGISGLSFLCLAILGHNYPMMITAITVENICSGMGNAALQVFIMSACDRRFTATQFALFSSLFAFTRVIGGAPTGWMAKGLGWPMYFVVSVFAMIPGLLLLTRFSRWSLPSESNL